MSYIKKIILHNFKIFENLEINTNRKLVIFIGDNGVGKSTILEAIQLMLTGSQKLVESIGINNIMNINAVNNFLDGNKKIKNLPKTRVEIFLDDNISDATINGNHYDLLNSDFAKNGLSLTIKPNLETYEQEIKEILENTDLFPYEYYKIEFKTFSGKTYSQYTKTESIYKHKFVRNFNLNYKKGMKDYIKEIYESIFDETMRKSINISFRENTFNFIKDNLKEMSDIDFQFEHENENSFQNNLTIYEKGININNLGHGEKLMVNIEADMYSSLDKTIMLLEEPETHLSYLNMHKLINLIKESTNDQIFITTHNNMIASRLDLRNLIVLNGNNKFTFNDISKETSIFFEKSTNTNLLNFILSKKSILVEGNSEYILLDSFYEKINGNKSYLDNVSIISCDGIPFKRYIEIGEFLNKKIAILTDNDKKNSEDVISKYLSNENDKIKIFTDKNEENYTLEVSLYNNNEDLFKEKIETKSMTKGLLSFMLSNKTESAYRILTNVELSLINVPNYIKEAIEWIKE